MDTFCHPLVKPGGSLHVRREDNYLDLTIVLKDRAYSAGVSLDASPAAKQLLEPCDRVEVIFQKNKVTVLANGDDVIKNKIADQTDLRDALIRISESFCRLSRSHAETLRKRRDVEAFRDEALDCLGKIEEKHQEDFTKFILILNEKKKKIRELQRKLGIRTENPEVIEDDIGVDVSSDGPSQPKKDRVSDQLALEAPSSSTSQLRSRVEGDEDARIGMTDGDDDEEFASDEELSDRARSEAEEIDEDDPPSPKISPGRPENEENKEERSAEAIDTRIGGGKVPLNEIEESAADDFSPKIDHGRPTGKKPSPKKSSLDILDDLL